jgi:hypothetical protein
MGAHTSTKEIKCTIINIQNHGTVRQDKYLIPNKHIWIKEMLHFHCKYEVQYKTDSNNIHSNIKKGMKISCISIVMKIGRMIWKEQNIEFLQNFRDYKGKERK